MKKRHRLKRIERHSDEELDYAIQTAVSACARRGLDFFRLLHGVDAYMERRRRRDQRRNDECHAEAMAALDAEAAWGDN